MLRSKILKGCTMTLLILLMGGVTAAYAATYSYDELNRVTSVTYDSGQKIEYSYDAGGNLLSVTPPDSIPPTTTATLAGREGSNGWYTSEVTVTLAAADNEGGSGVKNTEFSFDGEHWTAYEKPFSVRDEGTTTLYFRSTDNADNTEDTKTQVIKIDTTPPTLTGAPTTSANAYGWYNADATVHFEASDNGSGVDALTPDTLVVAEGSNQSVIGTATDKAGNSTSITVGGINLDKTSPQVFISAPVNGAEYLLNQFVLANWLAIDALSGIDLAQGTAPSPNPVDTLSTGTKSFEVVAADKAGNRVVQTATYSVRYGYGGVLPPLSSDGTGSFNLGRTIPVKFQLKDANGTYIETAAPALYLAKVENNIPGSEITATTAGSSSVGNLFRYDATENQYIFNLATKGLSVGAWQLRIELGDGSSKLLEITLR